MYNITDYFKYTPYDNKISQSIVPDNTISELFFRENLLVDFPDQAKTTVYNQLKEAITSRNIHIVLFIGRSGSGKTTYLHQVDFVQKQQHSDYYVSDFFNPIKKPTSTDSESILSTTLNDRIHEVLDLKTVVTFQELFDKYTEKIGYYQWDSIFLRDVGYDYHCLFNNFISYNSDHYSPHDVQKLCVDIKNIAEKIALYIIAFVIKEAIENNKKCVVVFDNLDELSQEHLAVFLNDSINIAYSKAQSFFETYYPEYHFVDNCTILLSVRQSFTAYNNSAQLFDRYRNLSTTISFCYDNRADLSSIIEKRIKLYLEQEDVDNKERMRIEGIFSLFKNDARFINGIGQLCNYDCRKALGAIAAVFENTVIPDNNILKESDCKAGARGLLLFRIFHSRIHNAHSRFRMYADKDLNQEECNMNRMLFSLLANMSLTVFDTSVNNVNYQDATISLLDFTERIKKWYKNANIRYIYETLLVSGNHNHSIPATLSGEIISQFIADHQYKASLNNLCEYMVKLFETDKTRLNHVDVIVNPVSVAYAKRVFIHYEYFNVLSSIYNNIEQSLKEPPLSLFQMQTKNDISKCLERVYKTTIDIITKSDKHFCSHCEFEKDCPKGRGNWRENCMVSINKFAEEKFLITNTLYTSRVITSHIRYLDVFRRYLWLKALKENSSVDRNMQMIIIEYIEKYVTLYKTKAVLDTSIGNIIEQIKTNMDLVKKNMDEWHQITIDNNTNDSNGDEYYDEF